MESWAWGVRSEWPGVRRSGSWSWLVGGWGGQSPGVSQTVSPQSCVLLVCVIYGLPTGVGTQARALRVPPELSAFPAEHSAQRTTCRTVRASGCTEHGAIRHPTSLYGRKEKISWRDQWSSKLRRGRMISWRYLARLCSSSNADNSEIATRSVHIGGPNVAYPDNTVTNSKYTVSNFIPKVRRMHHVSSAFWHTS